MARRNLLALVRIPTALVFSVIQPVMFVLLFRYVFGGAIPQYPGGQYVNFLIPGILVQTTIFGAVGTAIGLAEDLQRGLIERFRALPMARMAVLAGRTVSDLGRNVLVLVIITVVGIAVGLSPPRRRARLRRGQSADAALRVLPLVGLRLRRTRRARTPRRPRP